jgi:hypothetical protein
MENNEAPPLLKGGYQPTSAIAAIVLFILSFVFLRWKHLRKISPGQVVALRRCAYHDGRLAIYGYILSHLK